MKINDYIKKEIEDHIDLEYLKFHSSLVPNIHSIKGVRIPDLRKIAKTVSYDEDVFTYLDFPILDSYEETMIYGLVIGYLKLDIEKYQYYLKKFLPHIDNWATCDTIVSNLKFTKKYLKEMYSFLLTYINSKKEFEVRFVIIMFLDYYLVDEYVDLVLEAISNIKQNDYYVKMALAWLLSICYIKYKEKTLHFLSLSCLDDWTYQKTLQKIMESNQVPLSEKEKIRRMKKARKEGIECQKI